MIYVASPYSHELFSVRFERFRQVSLFTAWLLKQNIPAYSPIAHTFPCAMFGDMEHGFADYEFYDKHMISLSTEMYLLCLDGWDKSVGVKAEVAYAESLGLQITCWDVDQHGISYASSLRLNVNPCTHGTI